MRTALCISGLPRHVEKAFPNIKANLIDPNQPDIFIHTWLYSKYPFSEEGIKATRSLRGFVENSYNPLSVGYASQFPFHNPHWPLDRMMASHARSYTRENFVLMLYSSWYSVQQANLLKELYQRKHGFTYDCVIRARFDIDYNQPVICADYPMDKIYIPNLGRPPEMTDDRFAFGPNDLMNAYASAFNLLDMVMSRRDKIDGIFCGETLVYEMLKMYNIQAQPVPGLVCGHVHG